MNSATARRNELQNLKECLEQGENQKFFDLLFPQPEVHESATYKPAVEEILQSLSKRKLLVEFARRGDARLVNRACGIIYQRQEAYRSQGESFHKCTGFPTKQAANAKMAHHILKRLHGDMKKAQLEAVSTPPPALEEVEVEAA